MFKLPSYNVFDYKPRTYDQELERRRELLRELREEQGKDMGNLEPSENYKPGSRIKGSMQSRITRKRKKTNTSTIRLVIFILLLCFVAYLILVADLSTLISLLTK